MAKPVMTKRDMLVFEALCSKYSPKGVYNAIGRLNEDEDKKDDNGGQTKTVKQQKKVNVKKRDPRQQQEIDNLEDKEKREAVIAKLKKGGTHSSGVKGASKEMLGFMSDKQISAPHEIRKWIKRYFAKNGRNYAEYVEKLNQMLKNDRARKILSDVFDGQTGQTWGEKFNIDTISIPVKDLRPTQREVDVDKSLKFCLQDHTDDNGKLWHAVDTLGLIFSDSDKGVEIGCPIITYNAKFVIDGHHRWSQTYCLNDEAKMKSFNIQGKNGYGPMDILKASQGAVAATVAQGENTKRTDEVPSNVVKGKNLFDTDAEFIKKYVLDNISEKDGVVKFLAEKYQIELENNAKELIAEHIAKNCMELVKISKPIAAAPSRGIMPQTDTDGQKGKKVMQSLSKGVVVPPTPKNAEDADNPEDIASITNENAKKIYHRIPKRM